MTNPAPIRFIVAPAVALALLGALAGPALADPTPAGGAQAGGARQLRVCGDPNNLPFSSEKLDGIENKIADVVAKDLGMTVVYFWWPHQRGLIKRVLGAKHCDVMLGIPKGYDPVLWTRPYYRTGYVMVYRKDRKLKLRSLDDPALKTLKIGVQVNTPPHDALGRRGIADNVVGYQLMFDSNFHAEDYPGKVVEDVLAGQIDVAMVWGPIAGYFAKKKGAPLEIVPIDDPSNPTLPFAFDISMGVRKGDKELKEQLEGALARRHDDIEHILEDFGVPLLPAAAEPAHDKSVR
ncbi:MAG TPA: substrate-binding domain-containing protein [Kofleriaceae bacterium]|jgi:mxaJ protein|nr:substrate-binding domain-containing protein [Kofleriaceae bacterium]